MSLCYGPDGVKTEEHVDGKSVAVSIATLAQTSQHRAVSMAPASGTVVFGQKHTDLHSVKQRKRRRQDSHVCIQPVMGSTRRKDGALEPGAPHSPRPQNPNPDRLRPQLSRRISRRAATPRRTRPVCRTTSAVKAAHKPDQEKVRARGREPCGKPGSPSGEVPAGTSRSRAVKLQSHRSICNTPDR
uniref:Uncharacterized protein n=1 Tax=Knipowitschia caucasica TaxID=637954 RepID=A0AAV2JPP6_KNICA